MGNPEIEGKINIINIILHKLYYNKFTISNSDWCCDSAVESRGQFHQHFMSSFCTDFFVPKNYEPKPQVQKSCSKDRKMLMKLTPGVFQQFTLLIRLLSRLFLMFSSMLLSGLKIFPKSLKLVLLILKRT